MIKESGSLRGVFLCVVLIVFCGCTERSVDQEYVNETYGFACNPPLGWKTLAQNDSNAVGFSPNTSANASLTIAHPLTHPEGLALSVYADDVEEAFASDSSFSVQRRTWRDHPRYTAYEIVYVYKENNQLMAGRQVAVQQTRTVFLLSFTAPVAAYDQFSEGVDHSIDSFLII